MFLYHLDYLQHQGRLAEVLTAAQKCTATIVLKENLGNKDLEGISTRLLLTCLMWSMAICLFMKDFWSLNLSGLTIFWLAQSHGIFWDTFNNPRLLQADLGQFQGSKGSHSFSGNLCIITFPARNSFPRAKLYSNQQLGQKLNFFHTIHWCFLDTHPILSP